MLCHGEAKKSNKNDRKYFLSNLKCEKQKAVGNKSEKPNRQTKKVDRAGIEPATSASFGTGHAKAAFIPD